MPVIALLIFLDSLLRVMFSRNLRRRLLFSLSIKYNFRWLSISISCLCLLIVFGNQTLPICVCSLTVRFNYKTLLLLKLAYLGVLSKNYLFTFLLVAVYAVASLRLVSRLLYLQILGNWLVLKNFIMWTYLQTRLLWLIYSFLRLLCAIAEDFKDISLSSIQIQDLC